MLIFDFNRDMKPALTVAESANRSLLSTVLCNFSANFLLAVLLSSLIKQLAFHTIVYAPFHSIYSLCFPDSIVCSFKPIPKYKLVLLH